MILHVTTAQNQTWSWPAEHREQRQKGPGMAEELWLGQLMLGQPGGKVATMQSNCKTPSDYKAKPSAKQQCWNVQDFQIAFLLKLCQYGISGIIKRNGVEQYK